MWLASVLPIYLLRELNAVPCDTYLPNGGSICVIYVIFGNYRHLSSLASPFYRNFRGRKSSPEGFSLLLGLVLFWSAPTGLFK
jgi:hypothetical protein